MSKIILFTLPTEKVFEQIGKYIFPANSQNKTIAFVPSDGLKNLQEKYRVLWDNKAAEYGYKIDYVDLAAEDFEEERKKLDAVSVLIISGGNTFTLMDYINKTGFSTDIKKFIERDDTVYAGFSAGAIILSPTIKVAGYNWQVGHDENEVGLTDLTGIGINDFEVLPHYDAEIDAENLEKYRSNSPYEVKTIGDEEVLII